MLLTGAGLLFQTFLGVNTWSETGSCPAPKSMGRVGEVFGYLVYKGATLQNLMLNFRHCEEVAKGVEKGEEACKDESRKSAIRIGGDRISPYSTRKCSQKHIRSVRFLIVFEVRIRHVQPTALGVEH